MGDKVVNAGSHARRHRTSYHIRSIGSWMNWGTATVLRKYLPASHLLRYWRLISTLCLRATLLLRIGEGDLLRGASEYYSRGSRNREMDPWRSVPEYIRTVLAILRYPGSVTDLLCLKACLAWPIPKSEEIGTWKQCLCSITEWQKGEWKSDTQVSKKIR